MRIILLILAALPLVAGHGSVVHPPPRNAVDSDLAPWNGTVPVSRDGQVAFDPWCPIPSADGPETPAGRLSGRNGQACFWFSSGCSIGCPKCDGGTRGPFPNIPCKRPGDKSEMCARKMEVCNTGRKMPTLPRHARTVDTDKVDGAADDWYQYSPWRAPGSAGVIDPCGVAGGKHAAGHNLYGIEYRNTTHAKAGDHGSALKRRETGTVWTAGDVVEVSWTVNANHGGGYYWRLCKLPTDSTLVTEACFQRTPLKFVGKTRFRWNGDPATEEEIDNVFVSTGTTPPGSTWAMNPIPRNDSHQTGASFAPKCKETCSGCSGGEGGVLTPPAGGACAACRCTGAWGPTNLEIVDHVALPWMLPAGDYVIGWRWDTEESNQVWNACSDVTIKAHPNGSLPVSPMDDDAVLRSPRVAADFGRFGKIPCPLPDGPCFNDAGKPGASVPSGGWSVGGKRDIPFKLPLNSTLLYARELLQQAVMVEHSVIPLYLTSLFSIINGSEYAATTIHSVVIEEMLHMTIAANTLNAVGGAPMIDAPDFIPVYPFILPLTNVSVDVRRFDQSAIRNFMLVESITNLKKSITGAYEYVLSLLEALCKEYGEPAVFTGNYSYQVQAVAQGTTGLQTARKITNLSEAISALLGVCEQGGGSPVPGQEQFWPDVTNISAGPLGGSISHYARFAEIDAGRRWQANDTISRGPTGTIVTSDWEHVYTFEPNPKVSNFEVGTDAYELSRAFASNYTSLLVMLHNVFNGAPETYFSTLRAMHALPAMAKTLMAMDDPRKPPQAMGIGPPWEYVPTASQYTARGGKARPIFDS